MTYRICCVLTTLIATSCAVLDETQVSDGCIDCMAETNVDFEIEGACDSVENATFCGPYYLQIEVWQAVHMRGSTANDLADFLTCSEDPVCSRVIVRAEIEGYRDACQAELGVRSFDELSCAEYGYIWAANRGSVCSDFATSWFLTPMLNNCPGARSRPISPFNVALCETDIIQYGVCQMNDQPCSDGTYTDGLCRHPSNTGQVVSSGAEIHRSCCIEGSASGYPPIGGENVL